MGIFSRNKLAAIQDVINRKDNQTNIAQLTNYVAEVKQMNIAKSKELVEMHVNMAAGIKDIQSKDKNFAKCHNIEHSIMLQYSINEIVEGL